MSNLADHEAEQAAITAACEAGLCDHPDCAAMGAMIASRDYAAQFPPAPTPCERAQQIMDDTADNGAEEGDYPNRRRAARVLLAIAPAYDDDTTEQGIQDAITDLMHLCDLAGWSFIDMKRAAYLNYWREVDELRIATDDALRAAIHAN
jgi:hypothetical protein